MKKLIAMALAMVMVCTMFVACGGSKAPQKAAYEGTMEELCNTIIESNPVEFMGGQMPVDLTDTSEDGEMAVYYYTGLQNGEKLSDIAVFEPMMGSLAFSLVLVRVTDAGEAKTVGQEIYDNIDTRKWVCVEANEKMVAGYGDVVMLIMLDNGTELSAQSFVDAFQTACGGELDFTI